MSECGPCKRNGQRREGGPMGLCFRHQKQCCRICGAYSLGDELCVRCKCEDDIIRWQEAAMRVIDPEDWETDQKLRREKLWRAKYHVHKAIEILFRGLEMSTEAVWGNLKKDEPKESAREVKKAA